MYSLFKMTHLLMVALTIGLFLLRGRWMLFSPERLQMRWVKITPHIIDTILLASAIGLCITIGQYPLVDGWLTAKLFGLLLYILLGTIALKRGKTKTIRSAALVAALVILGYLLWVARTHQALPWLVMPAG